MKGLALAQLVNDAGTLITIDRQTLDRLEASGAGWVRIAPRLGSRPGWDHQLLTIWAEVADLFRQRRIQIVGTLSHEIVAGASQAKWNSYDAAVSGAFRAAFVAAAAEICAALWWVEDWEVWNEPNAWTTPPPNQSPSGGTYIVPQAYAELLAETAAAIRRPRPKSTVILGGLFAHNLHGALNVASSGAAYLHQLYAVPVYPSPPLQPGQVRAPLWDAIGYHPYLDQGAALVPGHLNIYLDNLQAVVRQYEGRRASRPVYVTEAGWSTAHVSPAVQAANVSALYQLLQARPEVQAACWFTLRDVPQARIAFGLLDQAGDPKPAYAAFEAVR